MDEVAEVQAEYDDLLGALPAHRRDAPEVQEIRWMIEELRVSLFAQDLKTRYPVSAVRVFRAIDALR
jgi:ATP-dependent helicase HrpA